MLVWTLASVAATVYQIFVDGCRDTIQPVFGPRVGILVSDQLAAAPGAHSGKPNPVGSAP
jgi:hypothetical protein